MLSRLALLAAAASAASTAACASSPPAAAAPAAAARAAASAPAAAGVPGHPLGGLAGERVAVLPVQRYRLVDSTIGGERPSLAALDSAIGEAVRERGVNWAVPADVERAARRNPTYASDPHRLSVGALLPGRKLGPDGEFGDPLASQLRTVVALADARYAVVPSELRLEPTSAPGSPRAVLRVALVDARAAQLRWYGDVAGDAGPAATSPAALAAIARRFADLIAAP